ncbi:thioredoxin family protein [Candidatus Micrarchaeota archaeon]|nr:thioredoxin family protein [Candidatus Micrarchaeota archaeon]
MDSKWLFVGIIVVVIVGALAFGAFSSTLPYASDLSPVMYFYSDDCVHCQRMKPILSALGDSGYRVKMMNVQKNPQYWSKYNVSGTPTWIAANGDALSGEQSQNDLKAWFDAHGAKIA